MRRLQRLWGEFSSIRVRLTFWYVLLLALILAGFCTFVYVSMRRALCSESDHLLLDEERGLSTAVRNGDEANLTGLLADVPAGTIVVLVDTTSGRVLAAPARGSQAAADLRRIPVQPDASTSVLPVTLAGDTSWRVATMPVTSGDQTTWIVRVARSDQDVEADLQQLLVQMALACPLALLVAVGSGLFLARKALDPIDAITRTATRIGAEDLGQRLRIRGRDEVGRLAATFDAMLDRLERAFGQQRQFTADASHELRTPLAMLTSQIDIALERTRSQEQYEQTLRSLRDDVADLSRLVSEMLMLARAEAGQEPLAYGRLDLGEIAAGVVSSMKPLASARKIRLMERHRGDAHLDGDETRLVQLTINLVDNAIKYTPQGGHVTVTTRREPGWAILEVADSGPGIRPEHRQRIFERFYRLDSARPRGKGAGLGLAISRWVVEAHGGEIRVGDGASGGATLSVRLPVVHTVVPAPLAPSIAYS